MMFSVGYGDFNSYRMAWSPKININEIYLNSSDCKTKIEMITIL